MDHRIGYEGRLLILAFDHRASFAREVLGGRAPDAAAAAQVREAKRMVFDGLLAAAATEEVSAGEVGVLIDEQYGGEIPRLARERGMPLAVAVERSGQEVFEFEYGDRFVEHVESADPDFAKVLVRFNPDGDAAVNAVQLERLKLLGDRLRERGRAYLFELLVPPTKVQLSDAGGEPRRYELESRPGLILRAMTEIQAYGIEPDVWKLEGIDAPADAARIAIQARSEPRWASVCCVVLGAGADDPRVERWLEVAAGTRGYQGFAIGRSIWKAPLRAHLSGEIDRDAVAAEVRDRFLHFTRVYLAG